MEAQIQARTVVIPHLPNEVLIVILSHLPQSGDLASVALASRNFNVLVQEFLYRSLYLNVRCPDKEGESDEEPHTLYRFSRLIDHLSANPELGLQTVALSLTVPHRLWYIFEEHHRLMQCLPKLQHVTLSPPPMKICIPNGLSVSSIRLDFHHLSNHYELESDLTDAHWNGDAILLTVISEHLWLPNLRKLQVENLNCGYLHLQTPRHLISGHPASGRSAVVDLRFVDCHDGSSGAFHEGILSKVEALKRLVFVGNSSAVFDGLEEHRRPSLAGISRGLIRHMAQLEELVLSPSDGTYGKFFLREWYFDHCFTNLRSVALPKCLLDQDLARRSQCLLPKTLEELQIQFTISAKDCERSGQADAIRQANITAVEWLANAKLLSFPRLKRVVWWYQPCELDCPGICIEAEEDPFYGCLSELRRLRRQFSDVEVDFDWILVRLFKDTPFGKRLSE